MLGVVEDSLAYTPHDCGDCSLTTSCFPSEQDELTSEMSLEGCGEYAALCRGNWSDEVPLYKGEEEIKFWSFIVSMACNSVVGRVVVLLS